MASTIKTPNLDLSQFKANDIITWNDVNSDFLKIDSAVHTNTENFNSVDIMKLNPDSKFLLPNDAFHTQSSSLIKQSNVHVLTKSNSTKTEVVFSGEYLITNELASIQYGADYGSGKYNYKFSFPKIEGIEDYSGDGKMYMLAIFINFDADTNTYDIRNIHTAFSYQYQSWGSSPNANLSFIVDENVVGDEKNAYIPASVNGHNGYLKLIFYGN